MKLKCSMKVAIACVMIFALAMTPLFISKPKTASADPSNVTNYKEAKAFLANVKSEYDSIMNQASAIYNKIEETTVLAFEAQRAMTESQLYLNELFKYEYMNSTMFSILITIACSTSLDDLSKNMEYANSVMDYQFKVSQENAKRKATFDSRLQELTTQNAEQNACLTQASAKLAEANEVLQGVRAKLTPEELAELEGEISDIGGGGGGDTPTPGPTPPGPTPPGPSPDPGPSWATGIASAYGGSSDPYTPNPGTTATGEICDDWSTGVAIPMAWPNFRSYFHHTVQIS